MGKTPEMTDKVKGSVTNVFIYHVDGKVVKVD